MKMKNMLRKAISLLCVIALLVANIAFIKDSEVQASGSNLTEIDWEDFEGAEYGKTYSTAWDKFTYKDTSVSTLNNTKFTGRVQFSDPSGIRYGGSSEYFGLQLTVISGKLYLWSETFNLGDISLDGNGHHVRTASDFGIASGTFGNEVIELTITMTNVTETTATVGVWVNDIAVDESFTMTSKDASTFKLGTTICIMDANTGGAVTVVEPPAPPALTEIDWEDFEGAEYGKTYDTKWAKFTYKDTNVTTLNNTRFTGEIQFADPSGIRYGGSSEFFGLQLTVISGKLYLWSETFDLSDISLDGNGHHVRSASEIPILVFNPNPYWVEQEVEVEFQLEEQNFNVPEVTLARVRTPEGVYLPTQNIKEDCTFNLDWRKRIVFRANLKPMSMNRFDCELYVINEPKRPIAPYTESETHFLFKNERMQVAISKETGLIDQYCVDGVNYLKTKSAQIRVYDDNEDPWRMQVDGFYHQSGAFQLVSNEEVNVFNGYPQETIENVRVIENGDVITRIQAIFKHANSFAVVTYTMSKFDTYVDVRIKLYSNDANKMYKLSFPTTFEQSKFVGQMAFGTEELLKDEKEVFYQKWCGLFEGQRGLAVLNNGTYGGSCKDSTLNISLLRTPVYSAHPIGDRQIAETDRNLEHMDMGEREFAYRLTTDMDCLDAEAERFNQRVYALSFFPSGQGESKDTLVELTNKKMILTRYDRGANGKCCLRIYNASEMEQSGSLQIEKQVYEMSMRPFEYHTYEWVQGRLSVID